MILNRRVGSDKHLLYLEEYYRWLCGSGSDPGLPEEPVYVTLTTLINQSINQSINLSINQLSKQSIRQLINQIKNKSINQTIRKLISVRQFNNQSDN